MRVDSNVPDEAFGFNDGVVGSYVFLMGVEEEFFKCFEYLLWLLWYV